ncbi:bidirectional sugar transporter SWEET4-like [Hordeum vulgare subsp. vulgare]|uniref:bidirectional sugar transporter SWEET4-like n=1 Tax=Hordeum vulgare subsp. vulgare TaxID=112509 RepID=UPI001D1A3369|nr:bidirectional sugar transporter SWEET4-like [Hordeum vulgare subsp. vulgare]
MPAGPAPPAAVVSSPPPPSSAPARTNIGKAVAAHAAATFGPQPGAPCDPALLATQAALFCAPDMATAQCCEPVVAAVDLGGGVPCLCRVAAEPPLVMAGLNASHLLKLYTSCGGLQDGARFAAACEGLAPSPAAVVSSLPPSPSRRRKQATHDATALPPSSKKPSSLSPSPQQNVGAAPAESKSMELVFLVLGYVFTGVLYLSPIPTIWQIATTNEVGMYKPDVHVLTLGSCVIGLLYGVPDPFKKGPVIFNAVGILIQIVYLGIFFRSSTAAQRRTVLFHLVMIGGAVAMQALLVFLLCPQPRYRYMLSICVAGMTTGMYSGPVRQMLTVWATKNVNHMSIWMAGASLFSGIFRTVYAFLTRDWFGFAAYIIGAVSGLVQLTLFLTVKFRYQQQPGA